MKENKELVKIIKQLLEADAEVDIRVGVCYRCDNIVILGCNAVSSFQGRGKGWLTVCDKCGDVVRDDSNGNIISHNHLVK